jgi:cobalt-zinc-cadmium efflux system protein
VLALSAAYVVAEVVGGLLTGSLALFADAGHTVSDVGALAVSLLALWIAQQPASARHTFGNTRAEILAALVQGVALLAVAIVIIVEAISRLGTPTEVGGVGMMVVASGGLAINAFGLWLLHHGQQENLNIRGAWLHVASDGLGSLGVIIAGFAIWAWGLWWADPVASLAISVLITFAAWQLLREVVDILMESAPAHLDVKQIRAALESTAGVGEVHDLHVWTIGSGEISLSSHIVASPEAEVSDLLPRLQARLAEDFEIRHSTLQIEPHGTADEDCAASCEPAAASATR